MISATPPTIFVKQQILLFVAVNCSVFVEVLTEGYKYCAMLVLCVFYLLCVLPCSSFFLSELWIGTDETEGQKNGTSPELRTLTEQNRTWINNGTSPRQDTRTEQNTVRANKGTSPKVETITEQNGTRDKERNDMTKDADNETTIGYVSTERSFQNFTITETSTAISSTTETPDPEAERLAEEQMHVEYIKKHLMAKLRLTAPPVSDNQASSLPLSELGKDYLQTQRDQGAKKYKPHHFFAKALQIYVMGKDGNGHYVYHSS